MAVLKYDSDGAGTYLPVVGSGPPGVGVPTGGTAGQVLTKQTSSDYDTYWGTPVSGGGSGESWPQVYNVKDAPFNAVGNGVNDDTAAIKQAVATCIADVNPITGRLNRDLFFPAGTYKVTSSDVLMNRDGGTPGPIIEGYHIRGMGKRRSIISYETAAGAPANFYSNNLGTFDGRVKYFQMTGMTLKSNNPNHTALAFYSTWSNPNQDMRFTDIELQGNWNRGWAFDGPYADANLNSEVAWDYCAATNSSTYEDAIVNVGVSEGFDDPADNQLDQFLNYWFNHCKFEYNYGDCLKFSRGGCVVVTGGSYITGAGGSTVASTIFTLGNPNFNTGPGSKSFLCMGVRTETRASTHSLLKHYWGGGSSGARCTFIEHADHHHYSSSADETQVQIYAQPAAGDSGVTARSFGMVKFIDCELKGNHMIMNETATNRGKLVYDGCTFLNYVDTDPVASTTTGFLRLNGFSNWPAYRFQDCYRTNDANAGGGI